MFSVAARSTFFFGGIVNNGEMVDECDDECDDGWICG